MTLANVKIPGPTAIIFTNVRNVVTFDESVIFGLFDVNYYSQFINRVFGEMVDSSLPYTTNFALQE